MEDLHIEPPDESEQESSSGSVFLRIGATFLCVLLGIFLILLGYMAAILMDLELAEFNANASIYFSVSIALWMIVGLTIPFALIQRLFEELKGLTFGRVVVFALVIGAFVILHWYIISLATQLLVSVFGTE